MNSTLRKITAKINKALKLDDAGRIDKFFAKEEKLATSAIRNLKSNKANAISKHSLKVDDLKERIEDAEENVQDALTAITAEDVKNNEAAASFRDSYWDKITIADQKLENLKDQWKSCDEAHENNIKDIDEQIGKYELRIKRIL